MLKFGGFGPFSSKLLLKPDLSTSLSALSLCSVPLVLLSQVGGWNGHLKVNMAPWDNQWGGFYWPWRCTPAKKSHESDPNPIKAINPNPNSNPKFNPNQFGGCSVLFSSKILLKPDSHFIQCFKFVFCPSCVALPSWGPLQRADTAPEDIQLREGCFDWFRKCTAVKKLLQSPKVSQIWLRHTKFIPMGYGPLRRPLPLFRTCIKVVPSLPSS